jgi:type II secretory pathway pseudopilin PulG
MRTTPILWLMGASAIMTVGCSVQKQKQATARLQLAGLATAIDAYEVDKEHLPINLSVLAGNPPFGGPYIKATDSRVDTWGTAYCYAIQSNHYDLRSAGPDKKLRTDDDIVLKERTPNQTPGATR